MWIDFVERVTLKQDETDNNIALLLNPQFNQMPLPIQRYDDPFFPFSKAIIAATQDLVCTYVFDLASYMALGAAGVVALERSIGYVARRVPTVLHGPFVGTRYTAMADRTAFDIDAITVADQRYLATYLENPPYAAFIASEQRLSKTSIPEQGGIFSMHDEQLILSDSVDLRLTNDAILYAGQMDDFDEQVRQAVMEF